VRDKQRFLRTLKREVKRAGNRKRRRFLKNLESAPDDFDFGRDRTDLMNQRPRKKPQRWERKSRESDDAVER
jgi:hypothetical protein